MVGGGIRPDNAGAYLEAGASHVIVTSYVFQNGELHYERLKEMKMQFPEKSCAGFKLQKKERRLLYCNRPMAEIYGGFAE